MVVKARLAKGPAWDCSRAWLAGGMAAWSSLYMAVLTGVVACCCHPRVLGASSVFASVVLGWIPCVNSVQVGGVHPRSSSAWAAAAAAEGCWRCSKICAAYRGSWVWRTGNESAHDDQNAGVARMDAHVRPRPP